MLEAFWRRLGGILECLEGVLEASGLVVYLKKAGKLKSIVFLMEFQ